MCDHLSVGTSPNLTHEELVCCASVEEEHLDIVTIIMSSSIVLTGLCLCLCLFIVIIWYHDLYQPRYIHQANALLASFFSLFTFGILFIGITAPHSSVIKCEYRKNCIKQ